MSGTSASWPRRHPVLAGLFAFLLALGLISALLHIPGPVPTAQAIQRAEDDPKITQFIESWEADSLNVTANSYANYTYAGYNDVGYLPCGPSPLINFTDFFPFHSFTTSTLFFNLVPHPECGQGDCSNGGAAPVGILAIQVNPTSGQIYSINLEPLCVRRRGASHRVDSFNASPGIA
jgi:hypothetical protein